MFLTIDWAIPAFVLVVHVGFDRRTVVVFLLGGGGGGGGSVDTVVRHIEIILDRSPAKIDSS